MDAVCSPMNFEGLFYSADSGATRHLATITDGSGKNVQGPLISLRRRGNAATAVVWNPVRQAFVAAVRDHGYYESPDGVTLDAHGRAARCRAQHNADVPIQPWAGRSPSPVPSIAAPWP